MFSPSDYNDAVPQFSNGNYANEPLNPLYVEEPDDVNYKRGAEPLQTLPVQWWNWLWNKITAKLNNLNIYVKNIFNELAALLSLVNVTPDATEEEVTTEQLKDMFATKYPQYLNDSDIFKTKYPKYLNDNFKFESLLQGRTRGVIVAPTDTWNNNTNTLSLTGGFGIINTYHKVTFSDCNLVIPNDDSVHFIVSNTSGVISIQNGIANNVILIGLCSNKQYCLLIDNNPDQCKDNIILKKWFGQHYISKNFVPTLQSYYDTAIASIETNISIETVDVDGYGIKEATLNNSTINIGTVTDGYGIYGSTLNNCTITIETVNNGYGKGIRNCTLNTCTITIKKVTDDNSTGTDGNSTGINDCTLNTCTITIETVRVNSNKCYGISDCTLDSCIITIKTLVGSGAGVNSVEVYGIYRSTLNNCTINIGTVTDGYGISYCTLNNCTITIKTIASKGSGSYGIYNDTLDNCTINIRTIEVGYGIYGSTLNNCTINIETVKGGFAFGIGIYGSTDNISTLNNCTINIETVNNGYGIYNKSYVVLYLTYIKCSAITSLSDTAGKLNILNDTVFHAS